MKLTNILDNQGVKYREAVERVKRVYLQDERPWIIGYSGGKDSTATWDHLYFRYSRPRGSAFNVRPSCCNG